MISLFTRRRSHFYKLKFHLLLDRGFTLTSQRPLSLPDINLAHYISNKDHAYSKILISLIVRLDLTRFKNEVSSITKILSITSRDFAGYEKEISFTKIRVQEHL